MYRFTLSAGGLLACALLAACTPEMNWREVGASSTRLKALMPCKPDEAVRTVPLAARMVEMHLSGCDAGGATFVIGWVNMPAAELGAALGEWQDSTLARAAIPAGPDAPVGRSFVPPGAQVLPQSRRLQAVGKSPDGKPLPLDAAWFVHTGGDATAIGSQAMFAAIYRTPASADAAENFFSNLRIR